MTNPSVKVTVDIRNDRNAPYFIANLGESSCLLRAQFPSHSSKWQKSVVQDEWHATNGRDLEIQSIVRQSGIRQSGSQAETGPRMIQ
jgi:hypothetical protein